MWKPSGRQRVMASEGFAEGVDRRRADIAEHDADRANGQFEQRTLGMTVRRVLRRLGLGASSRGDVHDFRLDRTGVEPAFFVPLRCLERPRGAALAPPTRCCNRWGQGRKARL